MIGVKKYHAVTSAALHENAAVLRLKRGYHTTMADAIASDDLPGKNVLPMSRAWKEVMIIS